MKAILTVILMCSGVWAHEGHEESTSQVQPPKGGIIKRVDDLYIELVAQKKEVKVYFYDKDLKPKSLSDLKIKAEAEIPRKKTKEKIDFKSEGSSLQFQFDAKGAHRYSLILSIRFPHEDHDDTIKFNVEPHK